MKQHGKLLIVDDSPLFRARMNDFLKTHYSFKVEEVNSNREMIEYLKKTGLENILLIILDLHLPDGNSLKALQKLKLNNKNFNKIPFLLVSARIDKETVAMAFKEGARDVIAKPVNYENLKKRIDNIITPEYKVKEKKTIMDYYNQITNEIKRAQRGKYPLSILLAGIFQKADFKSVHKESYYSKIIDLEKKYPDELKRIMRDTDTVVSLSPSEYLFILPFTIKEGTSVIHKKIQQVFNAMVEKKERDNLLMIVGAATYPEDGESTDDLILKIEKSFKKQFAVQNEASQSASPLKKDPAAPEKTKEAEPTPEDA